MTQQEVQNPVKRQFLFNPLKRPMPYIGFLLAILIIVFQSSIRQYTSSVIGDWLVSNIRDSTEGNYLLEYDFVRFDIFTKELRIKNLDLSLDTARIDEDTYLEHNNNLIYLSTPVVVLKLRSIWDLLVNDKIDIAYIGIQEPKVQLTRSEAISVTEKEAKQEAATMKIRSYLKELQVDSFRIVNGQVKVILEDKKRQQKLNFQIRDFTTLLKGFRFDNIDTEKVFHGIYAEEFELEILDQVVSLPQIQHQIGFKRLWISSNDSIIQLDTLKILPLNKENKGLNGDISFNQFILSGIDFKRAYLEGQLDVEHIQLKNPNISLSGKTKKESNKNDSEWLYVLFEQIKLHQIDVTDGDISINFGNKIMLHNLGITVSNYEIDSSFTNIEQLKAGLNDFHFNVTNSILELPDSIHQVELGQFYLTSSDSLAIINNIRISPIPGRRSYSLYKKRGVRQINYSSIKNIILSGINYDRMINDGQFLVDTLIISNPNLNITEYPYIRKKGQNNQLKPFLLKTIILSNGQIKYNKRQGGQNHRTEFTGIKATINNLFNSSENSVDYDNLSLQVNSGFSELKDIGHTIRFKGIKSKDIRDFDITRLSILPDSSTIKGEKIDLSAAFIRIRGFDKEALINSKELKLDLLSIRQLKFNGDFRLKKAVSSEKSIKKSPIGEAIINKFYVKNANFDLKTKDNTVAFDNISVSIDTLNYNSLVKGSENPIEFSDFLLSHGNFHIASNANKFYMSGNLGQFSDSDSLIYFRNLTFRDGQNIEGTLNGLSITGFDRRALLKKKALKFSYIVLDQPDFKFTVQKKRTKSVGKFDPDLLKANILSKITFVEFDSIVSKNASFKIASKNRQTELTGLNTIIGKYRLDSLSDPAKILSPEKLQVSIDKLFTRSKTDSVTVQAITLDMVNNRLFTGNILASSHLKINHLKIHAPGILASGFSMIDILQGQYSLDTIRLSGAEITLITPKDSLKMIIERENKIQKRIYTTIGSLFKESGNLMFDTLIQVENEHIGEIQFGDSSSNLGVNKLFNRLRNKTIENISENEKLTEDSTVTVSVAKKAISTNGTIKNIQINNSTFTLQKGEKASSYLSDLKFSIILDTLILDSINKFNVYNHVHNLTASIRDYKINLPDSLNQFSFDKLRLSTRHGQIDIRGLALTPRVSKYDYAAIKGYQASWLHLHGLDISLQKLDLARLISDNELRVAKISTHNGTLDIFKDKELPIPVNKRVPMPADALKSLKLGVLVDSVTLENLRINFTSRISSTNAEGSINFQKLNANVANITNIDSAISVNPYTIVSANTMMQGQGMLKANFNFTLNDENNRFIFDAHLDAMDANEFSNILEAMAFVKIESGKIKDLNLEAEGDNLYAIGNMRFLYNDLKVSTINKKNLKTKGMGKVIKTFFANAFVVKKNNPAFKFFPREGAMYFERDPQKVIIDYVTKTALSGVISSIGARNMRKDIKKIQRESKKQKDEERKALKKANKKGNTAG